jgi:methyl-accepting chemotaxis protein
MKVSLKLKLTIAFFILISFPMGILGYISYTISAHSMETSIKEQLKADTSDTSALIEKTIDSVKHSLKIASLNANLGKVAQKSSNDDIETAFEYLQNVQRNNQDSMEILIITDATGKVVMDNQTTYSNINLGDQDYVKNALIGGRESVSQVSTSKFSGKPAIFITYPLKDNGKIVGALVGSISFDSISKYAQKINPGKNGYTYMIDQNGLFVYHTDGSKILKENVSDPSNKQPTSVINEMKQCNTSDTMYRSGNGYKYIVFEPVNNWIIAVTADSRDYMASSISIRNYTIIIFLVSIIAAMICAYIFSTRSILNPIKKLKYIMKHAGEGDLTVSVDIKSRDEFKELGDSFNYMLKRQNEIVRNVSSAAIQLNAASEEMSASSQEVSATTEEIGATILNVAQDASKQHEAILDVSEVLVQLSGLVQLAQNRATVTSSNATHTMEVANYGRQKVEKTVQAIDTISKFSNETVSALESLNNLSAKVGGIIGTINSIAEQTNLLALNAAIEAARAGEHGRGFSVVADEVRKLSEESDQKAKEITILVNEMMKQTKNAVTAMQRSKSEVDIGVAVVSETDKSFIDIINAIDTITEHVNEILNITQDEVASSNKVVKLIDDISTITETNSTNSKNVALSTDEQLKSIESLTATAEETSAMAEELTVLVEKFNL